MDRAKKEKKEFLDIDNNAEIVGLGEQVEVVEGIGEINGDGKNNN